MQAVKDRWRRHKAQLQREQDRGSKAAREAISPGGSLVLSGHCMLNLGMHCHRSCRKGKP